MDIRRFLKCKSNDSDNNEDTTGTSETHVATSVRVQNELIVLTYVVVRDTIVKAANDSNGFSIIAKETADISGTEQLSIVVRFAALLEQRNDSDEEFIGLFIPLERIDAATIADTSIDQAKQNWSWHRQAPRPMLRWMLNHGRKDNCVHAHIRNTYPKAVFVHCYSHRLNLVVNYLNLFMEHLWCLCSTGATTGKPEWIT